jgi:hypothetical protein
MKPPIVIQKLPLDKIAKLNDGIALRSNAIFATMGFFWFCLIFSLIPLKCRLFNMPAPAYCN